MSEIPATSSEDEYLESLHQIAGWGYWRRLGCDIQPDEIRQILVSFTISDWRSTTHRDSQRERYRELVKIVNRRQSKIRHYLRKYYFRRKNWCRDDIHENTQDGML